MFPPVEEVERQFGTSGVVSDHAVHGRVHATAEHVYQQVVYSTEVCTMGLRFPPIPV